MAALTHEPAMVVGAARPVLLAPAGLRSTQFVMLAGIHKNGPVSTGQLADDLVMDRTTLTRNLKPLMQKKLVALKEGDDRRIRLVTLTAKGRRLLAAALPLWDGVQAEFIGGVGKARWKKMLTELNRTVDLTRPAEVLEAE